MLATRMYGKYKSEHNELKVDRKRRTDNPSIFRTTRFVLFFFFPESSRRVFDERVKTTHHLTSNLLSLSLSSFFNGKTREYVYIIREMV